MAVRMVEATMRKPIPRALRLFCAAVFSFLLPHLLTPSLAVLSFSLSYFLTPSLALAASPLGAAQRAFQLQGAHYGTLADDHPAVLRARGIFRKLARVAGSTPSSSLSLHVLATPKVIAQSYDQGIVVISLGLLERVGADDDALAFILGHEIAHQVRGHVSLLVGLGIQTDPAIQTAAPLRSDQRKTLQVLELDADRFGVLYSSLAGYRARGASTAVAAVTEALGADPFHPEPRERAREIHGKIAEILDHHEVYLLGLAYLAMDRPDAAAKIFEEFHSLYPSRELFLNLGAAYHKLALRYARPDEFERAIVIDSRSRIAATFRGADQPPHPLFTQYLERATEAYRRAVAMDPDDPVAHNDLGAAYLDAGQLEYALGEFRVGLRGDGGSAAAYNNRGIAYAKTGDLKRAEADLLEAANRDPDYATAFQNLAAVYRRLGNAAEARKAEEAVARLQRARVAPKLPGGPPAVGGLRPDMPWEDAAHILGAPASRQISVPLSITPGDELALNIFAPRRLAVAVEKGRVTAIGVLERNAAPLPNGIDVSVPVDRLRQALGTPARVEGCREISIWVYPDHGLAAFVAGGRANALWVVGADGK